MYVATDQKFVHNAAVRMMLSLSLTFLEQNMHNLITYTELV